MNSQELSSLQEAYLEVYDNIMEKEDSPYEKASDAALDARYGYGRAQGDKRSFGRAANRSSAAAALRAIRRGERSGSGTSREAGADAVHQGWARTAKTSADQTPEKKERRAGLANTPYSQLPDDEKEKDRVSFDAVRATYNRRNQREDFDLYDIVLSHLINEGYADTFEAAEVMMVHMSEEWREGIIEAYIPYEGKPQEKLRKKQEKLGDAWDKPGSEKRFHKLGDVDSRMTYPELKRYRETQNKLRDSAVKRRGSYS